MLAPHIPESFLKGLARDFGSAIRVRWSPVRNRWQLERRGKEVTTLSDPRDRFDLWVRVNTGFYRVLETSPGSLITCPHCGTDHSHPMFTLEAPRCPKCAHQDLVMNWPLGEKLLEHLRFTDPERDGLERLWRDIEKSEAALEKGRAREKANYGEAVWKDEFTRVFQIQSRGYEGPARAWLDAPESKRFGGNEQ